MRTTEIPGNNSGGLVKILAIPETSFVSLGYASGSVRSLNLTDLDNIICIECLPTDAGFQEKKTETDAGDSYDIEISGVIYGKSPSNDAIINDLRSGTWRVAHQDANGNFVASGCNNVRMVFESKVDTGQNRSSRKGTVFSFSCKDQLPSINIASIQ